MDKMKKITLKEFWNSEEKLVIHVRNKEEAKTLCDAFDKMGGKWSDGGSYLKNTFYSPHGGGTCYTNNGLFSSLNYCKSSSMTMYEFDEVQLDKYKISLKEFFATNKLLVIHVNNEEESRTLCQAMDRIGKSWKGGKSCVEDTKYIRFKEETCYTNTMQFCDKSTFEKLNCSIYEFEEVKFDSGLTKAAEQSD